MAQNSLAAELFQDSSLRWALANFEIDLRPTEPCFRKILPCWWLFVQLFYSFPSLFLPWTRQSSLTDKSSLASGIKPIHFISPLVCLGSDRGQNNLDIVYYWFDVFSSHDTMCSLALPHACVFVAFLLSVYFSTGFILSRTHFIYLFSCFLFFSPQTDHSLHLFGSA